MTPQRRPCVAARARMSFTMSAAFSIVVIERKLKSARFAENSRPAGEEPALMTTGWGCWIGFGAKKP